MRPAQVLLFSLLVLGLARLTVEAQERRGGLPEGVEIVRDIEYGKGGSTPLLLDVYRPKQRGNGSSPAVVWIHGGGWQRGDKNHAVNAAYLAAHGYLAVSIDYRLSGVAPFPAAIEDCKCAVRWLRAHAADYGVDPDRIGVWGDSAGANLSLLVGLAGPDTGLEGTGGWPEVSSRVQAVCDWFGATDMPALTGKERPRSDEPVTQYLGGTPDQLPDAYRKASPVTHVSAGDPPVFIAHGEKDSLVPLAQSEKLVKLLKSAGVENELLVVKNAEHVFKPSGGAIEPDLEQIRERCRAFFDKHLRRTR